jgi:hypothetical protein
MQTEAAVMDEAPRKIPLSLQQVPVQHLNAVFPHVAHWLASVVERSGRRYTLPVLVEMIARGEIQMWLIGDEKARGIVLTELYYAPSGLKFAAIRGAVGEGAEGWMHLIDVLEDWAAREGCVAIDALARKGWARRLPDYKLSHVFLEKELG